MITVTSWGVGGRVVGPGVAGRARLGASRGGAVDRGSFDLANRLLGNPPDAGAIETSGGTVLTFTRPTMLVLTGAAAQVIVTDGPPLGWGVPVVLLAGSTLRIGRLTSGARVYLGVRGGVVEQAGVLQIGTDPGTPAATVAAARREPRGIVRVWPGPRADWFTDGALERLCATGWALASTSSVGALLSGAPLRRVREGELLSEGMVEGAVQVPPDGQPIVMLADHPTTGGYPVLAVVDPRDLGEVAQAAPGTMLRFVRP
jgi:allophanate hydrolase subunit 2